VQYQQAYQAAAEVIKVAANLFNSILSAVQS
jgi:flagellar hook-associated protein FlgK